MKHIAIVTSGGDAPGTNAAIRAVARVALTRGSRVSGVSHGWEGVIAANYIEMTRDNIMGIIDDGGTVLKSSRTRLLTQEGDVERIIAGLQKRGIEGVVVIGGEGSHKGALALCKAGFPVVGVPKTIDNDLGCTDLSIGFMTAVQTATEAIDRLRTHTESHDRVMIVEVMGRHAGWIATYAGMASGADLILVPERQWSLDTLKEHLDKRHKNLKRSFSLIVAAEGAVESQALLKRANETRTDHLGRLYLGGIGEVLAKALEQRTGYECRSTNLGYLLRGGPPIAFDRILATRMGSAAADMLLDGKSGVTTALIGREIVETPVAEAVGKLKTVPDGDFALAERFF